MLGPLVGQGVLRIGAKFDFRSRNQHTTHAICAPAKLWKALLVDGEGLIQITSAKLSMGGSSAQLSERHFQRFRQAALPFKPSSAIDSSFTPLLADDLSEAAGGHRPIYKRQPAGVIG